MKPSDQVCTLSQMRKLTKLGFNVSESSCYYPLQPDDSAYNYPLFNQCGDKRTYPAYSVSDMIDMLPLTIFYDGAYYIISINKNEVVYDVGDSSGKDDLLFFESCVLRDNLFECLVWLKKNKLL